MVTGGFKGRGGGRNFVTGNGRVGSTLMSTFGRYPEHVPEPYEREEDMRRTEREKQKQKILFDRAFLNNSRGDYDFDRLNDAKDPAEADVQREHRRTQTSGPVQHPKPWAPTSP